MQSYYVALPVDLSIDSDRDLEATFRFDEKTRDAQVCGHKHTERHAAITCGHAMTDCKAFIVEVFVPENGDPTSDMFVPANVQPEIHIKFFTTAF